MDISRKSFLKHMGICALSLMAGANLYACGGTKSGGVFLGAYESPYSDSGFKLDDKARMTYTEGSTLCSRAGIDVASYQGEIDWEAVAADGIEFAIIKLGARGSTEGGLFLDQRFEQNLAQASAAGIDCGVYFFSQAVSAAEAREEAEFCLEALGGCPLSMPLVFDEEVWPIGGSESRAAGCSRQQLTDNALTFCSVVEQAGYIPMVYGNRYDVDRLDMPQIESYDFWFAQYDEALPDAEFDFLIWQYDNNGTVAGIDAAVDMNIQFTRACADYRGARL